MSNSLQDARAASFITRIQAWMNPLEAAKWLAPNWKINQFIETMQPIMHAAFLEVSPKAMERVTELLYAQKSVVSKTGRITMIEDNQTALKAAEMIFKSAWIWVPIVEKSWEEDEKKETLMDAIIIEPSDEKN